jgi:pimeloyl-ACP methyl ester carboxylesterase
MMPSMKMLALALSVGGLLISSEIRAQSHHEEFLGYIVTNSLATSYAFGAINHHHLPENIVVIRHAFKHPIPLNRKGVFCIHGLGDNGSQFEPLAAALINADKATDVYMIDLPGHSHSVVPDDTTFGQLDIARYQHTVETVLTLIRTQERRDITTIVGHSYGGLIVQLMQDKLVAQSSSLLAKYNIQNTMLIASDIPQALPWSGQGFGQFLVETLSVFNAFHDFFPGWSVITPFPPANDNYIQLKFTANGVAVSGAPTQTALPFVDSAEPYAAAANIVGLDPTHATENTVPRLSVNGGIFNGHNLTVVWLQQDGFFTQAETNGLAQYLQSGLSVTSILDPEAVHGTPYSKPSLLVPLFP